MAAAGSGNDLFYLYRCTRESRNVSKKVQRLLVAIDSADDPNPKITLSSGDEIFFLHHLINQMSARQGGQEWLVSAIHKVISSKKADVDINCCDSFHKTPLHYAVENNDFLSTWLLLKKGAESNFKNDARYSVIDYLTGVEHRDIEFLVFVLYSQYRRIFPKDILRQVNKRLNISGDIGRYLIQILNGAKIDEQVDRFSRDYSFIENVVETTRAGSRVLLAIDEIDEDYAASGGRSAGQKSPAVTSARLVTEKRSCWARLFCYCCTSSKTHPEKAPLLEGQKARVNHA